MTQDTHEIVESCIKGSENYINDICTRKYTNDKGKLDNKEFKKCKDKVNDSLLKAVEAGLKKCITEKMKQPKFTVMSDKEIEYDGQRYGKYKTESNGKPDETIKGVDISKIQLLKKESVTAETPEETVLKEVPTKKVIRRIIKKK